jgi:hypothetical protein
MDIYYNGVPFDGIMKKLYNKYKSSFNYLYEADGNTLKGWSHPLCVLNPPSSCVWASNWEVNSYIVFSFKKHLIRMTNYTYIVRYDQSANMPRGWKLEASNDKENWELLHNVTNCSDLDTHNVYKTYSCVSIGAYKYFRIMQTQTNWDGGLFFHVAKLEFFGTIYSSSDPFIKHSCETKTNVNNIFILFIVSFCV